VDFGVVMMFPSSSAGRRVGLGFTWSTPGQGEVGHTVDMRKAAAGKRKPRRCRDGAVDQGMATGEPRRARRNISREDDGRKGQSRFAGGGGGGARRLQECVLEPRRYGVLGGEAGNESENAR